MELLSLEIYVILIKLIVPNINGRLKKKKKNEPSIVPRIILPFLCNFFFFFLL